MKKLKYIVLIDPCANVFGRVCGECRVILTKENTIVRGKDTLPHFEPNCFKCIELDPTAQKIRNEECCSELRSVIYGSPQTLN